MGFFTRFKQNKAKPEKQEASGKRGSFWLTFFKAVFAFSVFVAGVALIWVSTFDIPDLEAFQDRRIEQSTKIYDRTGEVVLYDLNKDVRRTIIPFDEMSDNIKEATLAIEDSDFYDHYGIKPTAIARAIYINIKNGNLLGGQGGSTVTQQVVKNTLLTPEKTITRKVKEWILALRLEQEFTKDEILTLYLNEVPYGGRLYGVEEASRAFFGKSAADLTIAESAYLAALPKAPTYYSPYGNHRDDLEARKTNVLEEMLDNNFITEEEFEAAMAETVTFADRDEQGIKAPHFVFYVKEYLEETYGAEAINQRGWKVVTTLDWDLQNQAQDIVERNARSNAERFNAENGALVAVDPQTGQILTMVGSRDYSDPDIDGMFNAAVARRQPGSSFKPFVYATAFNKGYTDRTVVFDLKTQFSTACSPSNFTSEDNCFSPVNYDGEFRGPITLRNALAQSVNVPAVKALYLAGLEDSLATAERMGVNTLDKSPDRYGLSLVLGSGEVTPLDMTSAYGVFANEGIRHEHTPILRIEDRNGNVVEEFEEASGERVLPENTARIISSVLSDNEARTPAFGSRSYLYFENHDVAAKTGTTNEYVDAWIVGYTPNLAVGAWAGNNDSESMEKRVAGFIVAPMWREFMDIALEERPQEVFTPPTPPNWQELKPILRGEWRGGYMAQTDTIAQAVPRRENDDRENNQTNDDELEDFFDEDEFEPDNDDEDSSPTFRNNQLLGGVHSILHWVNKSNPRGPIPTSPSSDPQYRLWEYSVQRFMGGGNSPSDSTPVSRGDFRISLPTLESSYDDRERVRIRVESSTSLDRIDAYVNDTYLGYDDDAPFEVRFIPRNVRNIEDSNLLRIQARSLNGGETTLSAPFDVE